MNKLFKMLFLEAFICTYSVCFLGDYLRCLCWQMLLLFIPDFDNHLVNKFYISFYIYFAVTFTNFVFPDTHKKPFSNLSPFIKLVFQFANSSLWGHDEPY